MAFTGDGETAVEELVKVLFGIWESVSQHAVLVDWDLFRGANTIPA
jgi:hypothetical protein